MSDIGDLPSAISGGKFLTIIVIALLILPIPFLVQSCSSSEEETETETTKEFFLGSADEPTTTQIPLSNDWSALVKIYPGNHFNVVPELGKRFDFLPYGFQEQEIVHVEYGADVGPCDISSFQLRGDGVVTIYTSP